ncbi:MAG: 3-deoxy-manno-octulosonate cytidylyltransferase [bacterium]|nr:3-deoxy-manno-octulosonate cytidylyltransferase [bacterium]
MSFKVVIPARYGSSRLPGKPLLEIAGKPMFAHVYARACESAAEEVLIATDDERIASAARAIGAEVVMTSPLHPSGTDRLQEVVAKKGWADEVIVVNVQGDEPLIPPSVIDQVARNLMLSKTADIATLAEPLQDAAQLFNPNIVKLVRDIHGHALYFSRAPMPWARDIFAHDKSRLPVSNLYLRHLGVYAYRVGFLHAYVSWPPAEIELLESLEQLRALYNGVRIHVDMAAVELPPGVDTPEDLERVRAILAGASS